MRKPNPAKTNITFETEDMAILDEIREILMETDGYVSNVGILRKTTRAFLRELKLGRKGNEGPGEESVQSSPLEKSESI